MKEAVRNKRNITNIILITALIAAVVFIIIDNRDKQQRIPVVGTGEAIPEISLLDLEGNKVKVQEVTNSSAPMLINFWASWCKPCINELPILNEAQAFIPEVTFVAINMNEDIDRIVPFIERYDLTMKMLRDEQLSWKLAIAIQGYPVTILVDEHGIIRNIHRGAYTSVEEIIAQTSALAS